MTAPTLSSIETKFRQLTASQGSNQVTYTEFVNFVASFYGNDLPAEFRSLKLQDIYTFDTQRGISTYAFDSTNFTTLEAPARIAKRTVYFGTNPTAFTGYNIYLSQQLIQTLATGTGNVLDVYSGTTQNSPILRSVNNDGTQLAYPTGRVQNILITAYDSNATYNATDDGNGNIVGPQVLTGSINYDTGAVTNLTYSVAIPSGNNISIEYFPIKYSTPTSVLFYQDQLTLFPVPDKGYTVEIITYRTPNNVLLNTPANQGIPELREWWELIAVGAAKKFYESRIDSDGIAMMDKMLIEHYSIAESRTYAQLGQEQSRTIYSDQINTGWNNLQGYWNGN